MSRPWPVTDIDPEDSLAANARRILAVRMAEYYAHALIVPLESAVDELHQLRISAKRLRYTLEIFRAVFGDSGETQIERVKAIQEDLGAIHDHDVRIVLIEGELSRQAVAQTAAINAAMAEATAGNHAAITATALRPPPDDPRRGLIALLGREHQARRERYLAFKERWAELAADGMRADLAALSVSLLGTDDGEKVAAARTMATATGDEPKEGS